MPLPAPPADATVYPPGQGPPPAYARNTGCSYRDTQPYRIYQSSNCFNEGIYQDDPRYFELDPEGMTAASRMAMDNNNEGVRRITSNTSHVTSGRYSN